MLRSIYIGSRRSELRECHIRDDCVLVAQVGKTWPPAGKWFALFTVLAVTLG